MTTFWSGVFLCLLVSNVILTTQRPRCFSAYHWIERFLCLPFCYCRIPAYLWVVVFSCLLHVIILLKYLAHTLLHTRGGAGGGAGGAAAPPIFCRREAVTVTSSILWRHCCYTRPNQCLLAGAPLLHAKDISRFKEKVRLKMLHFYIYLQVPLINFILNVSCWPSC